MVQFELYGRAPHKTPELYAPIGVPRQAAEYFRRFTVMILFVTIVTTMGERRRYDDLVVLRSPAVSRPSVANTQPASPTLPLSSLEKQPAHSSLPRLKRKKLSRRAAFATGLFLLLIISAALLWYIPSYRSSGLPRDLRRSAGFQLYYPIPMLDGFTFQKNSAKLQAGILFFDIRSGTYQIHLSEQAIPPAPPDLGSLSTIGFKGFTTLSGNATVGMDAGHPVGILLTNASLVTVTGEHSVPLDVIANVIRHLSSL